MGDQIVQRDGDKFATMDRKHQGAGGPSQRRHGGQQRLWLSALASVVVLVVITLLMQLVDGQRTLATALGGSSPTHDASRGPLATSTAVPTSTPAPPKPLVLGAFIDQAPWSQASLNQYVSETGKAPSAMLWFQDWGDSNGGNLDANTLDAVSNQGIMPIISWEPQAPGQGVNQPDYALSTIINGQHDGYIRGWAHDAAVWGKPLYVRFAHEMNGTWYPWCPYVNGNGGGDQYIAAWRHIVDIFREEKATNVRWIWSPNTEFQSYPYSAQFSSMYPGDAYVDWIGLSGYNWGGPSWASFTDIYASTYAALTSMSSKQIILTEIGSVESGGNKADWITSALLTEIPHTFPHIRAVIWFDAKRQVDWRIDSSPSSLAAFKAAAQSTLYQGQLP